MLALMGLKVPLLDAGAQVLMFDRLAYHRAYRLALGACQLLYCPVVFGVEQDFDAVSEHRRRPPYMYYYG